MNLDTLCREIFTREKMVSLGIKARTAGRVANFFKPPKNDCHWWSGGPLSGWMLSELLNDTSYASWMRMKNCGPKCIEAMNKVLADIGQPQFKKQSH